VYNVDRLVRLMTQAGIDALIATTRENIFYFSGFDPVVKTLRPYSGECYVMVCRDKPDAVHVVHFRGEADQVLDAIVPVGHVVVYGTFYREENGSAPLTPDECRLREITADANACASPLLALAALLERLCLLRSAIGIDEDAMSPPAWSEFQALLPQARLLPASELLRNARRVKTSSEVDRLRQSARCLESAILQTAEAVHEGISEVEIAKKFETALVLQGARPSLTMVKIGRHAVGGQRRQRADIQLQPGDLLWFDCDSIACGYWADIARVFVFGEPKPEHGKFQALLEGQRVAMESVRPGMTGDQVFNLTMSAVHKAGFPDYRRHHVGHGIGLEPYERPILAPGNTDVIEPGMVLSIETPYYEFGLGALHVEDPILVCENSNERLTVSSGEMGVIPVAK
jgi:Xaa-Pro aminopeptidase